MLSIVLAVTLGVAPQTSPPAEFATDSARVVRVATAPAETLTVTIRGTGPAVVFVPGLLGSAYGFRHVVEGLVEAGHRTVVVDPLGLGSSSRPDDADYSLTAQADRIARAMREVGVERATLVCHAIGASMCFRMAVRQPGMVAGIVSINGGPAEAAGTPGLRKALTLASMVKMITGDDFIRGKLREGLRDASSDPAWVTDDVLRGYTRAFGDDLDPVLRGLRQIARAPEPEKLAPQLKRIDIPVLVLLGADDSDGGIPAEEIRLLLTELSRVDVDAIMDAGEYPQEENPRDVTAAILRFMRTEH